MKVYKKIVAALCAAAMMVSVLGCAFWYYGAGERPGSAVPRR